MKSKSNAVFFTAIVMIIAGICCFLTGFCMMDWDYHGLSTGSEYTRETTEFACPTEEIVVRDDNIPVFLSRSSDNQVHLAYYSNDEETYVFDANNDRLTIEKHDSTRWFSHFVWFQLEEPSLQLEIPESFDGSLDIETKNAKIDLRDLELSGTVRLDTSNGKISLYQVTTTQELTCTSSNGKLDIDQVKAKSIELKTSNSKIDLTDVYAKDTLSCKTSNGKIALDSIGGGEGITLKTSNGAIRGSIIGSESDYDIDSDTSNGSNNLDDHAGGDIPLNVHTSNGTIDIDFKD